MKSSELKKINTEVLELKSSPLYNYRVKNNYFPVIGEGSENAVIMLIGEAPGRNEAKTGKPFCGAAGKILDELLASITLSREDIYITNIVKDRPPENRDPSPEEIFAYGRFLDRQIDIIQPKIIATLGRYSMKYILKKFNLDSKIEPVGKAHGKTYTVEAFYGPIKVVALYHPCVALYNRKQMDTLKKDFKTLKKYA